MDSDTSSRRGSADDGASSASKSDDETWNNMFAAMSPVAVERIVRGIKSHELFPAFEEYMVGGSEYHSAKPEFGSAPSRDVKRWNVWLEQHGASQLRVVLGWASLMVSVDKWGNLHS